MGSVSDEKWDPFERRHTAPERPRAGIKKTVVDAGAPKIPRLPTEPGQSHGLSLQKGSKTREIKTSDGNKLQLLKNYEGIEVDRPEQSNVLNHTPVKSTHKEASYSLKIINSSSLSLFELKQSCKLDLDSMMEMTISEEHQKNKFSSPGQKSSSSTGTQNKDITNSPSNSVYGRKEKEERKRLRRMEASKKMMNHQEKKMNLKLLDRDYNTHTLRGTCQAVNNSSGKYFVLGQTSDGTFVAHPVDDWYTFEPKPKYKPLTVEEADEEFEKRNKILNFFSVMVKKRLRGETNEEEAEENTSKRSKIDEDLESWKDSSSSSENESQSQEVDEKKSRKKIKAKPKSGRRQKKVVAKSDEDDEESANNSPGNDADQSSSDSEFAEEAYEQRGVDEEDGMKSSLKWNSSDDSSDDDEGDGDTNGKPQQSGEESTAVEVTKDQNKRKKSADVSKKGLTEKQVEKNSEKKELETGSTSKKSHENKNVLSVENAVGSNSALVLRKGEKGNWDVKRPQGSNEDSNSTSQDKPPRINSEISKALRLRAKEAGVTKDAVRRYLLRKPTSTQELCQKFLSKRLNFTKEELALIIADHLSAINPSKLVTNGKTLMYIVTEADRNSVYLSMIDSQ